MRIDAKQYDGMCSCGRVHTMQTVLSVVEKDCLLRAEQYLRDCGLTGVAVAVYDENTYAATQGRHPAADREIILDPRGLHADERGVEQVLSQLPGDVKILFAVGAGTIHDITRYCAHQAGAAFVACPTAASVDGFCSGVAAMTWKGCKCTLPAIAPALVLADTSVFQNAPIHLAKSGLGDLLGKYISLADWRIGQALTGEYYCHRIADMTAQAVDAVLQTADGILRGDTEAYENLMYGLLLSGLAMQMLGNSRPASGAEHHISHIIEMQPKPLDIASDALHGEKVGVATLLVLEEYRRMAAAHITWKDYTPYTEQEIKAVFGEALGQGILAENRNNCTAGITAGQLEAAFPEITRIIRALPETEALYQLYRRLGVKHTLEEIGLSREKLPVLLEYSPCARNRLTLMRLRKCIGKETPA